MADFCLLYQQLALERQTECIRVKWFLRFHHTEIKSLFILYWSKCYGVATFYQTKFDYTLLRDKIETWKNEHLAHMSTTEKKNFEDITRKKKMIRMKIFGSFLKEDRQWSWSILDFSDIFLRVFLFPGKKFQKITDMDQDHDKQYWATRLVE